MNIASPDTIEDTTLDSMLEAAVPPPKCEWRTKKMTELCGEPATWILTSSCGHSAYYDDEHADVLRSQGIGDESSGPTFCDATSYPKHPRMMRVSVRFDRIAS